MVVLRMWRSISTNKSSNLRKSSAIIFKEHKGTKIRHFRWTRKKTKLAFSGTAHSLTMLTGVYNSPQNSELKLLQLYLVQCCRRKWEVARAVPSVIHKVKIFHTCFGDVTLYCPTVANVCEWKCVNVTNVKLKKTSYCLVKRKKEFESDEIFDFNILFAVWYLFIK